MRFEVSLTVTILAGVISTSNCNDIHKDDKLDIFYRRLMQPDVKKCEDTTRLMPDCTSCIPGLLQSNGSATCDSFVKSTIDIRSEIGRLTSERYGAEALTSSRPFGLYPYLEGKDFIVRQQIFGRMLSEQKAMNILDIGAYYNPINLFFKDNFCPSSVVVVEPILDALSAIVPCPGGSSTHYLFLPITFKFFLRIKDSVPQSDSIVCIGCDSHYGPNRRLLETSFPRPYKLFLEYPSEYVHNVAFKKMIGTGEGELMTFFKKFQPVTNETQYTMRVMKVIEYV